MRYRRYYLSDILEMIGITDPQFKGKLNVGLTAWNLVNGVLIALFVTRFARRKMYLLGTCGLFCVYVGWTIAQERFLSTNATAAGRLVIFFIFLYSPAYNTCYNALTYSKLSPVRPLVAK